MRTDCPDCPAGYDPETQDPDCPHYGKIDLMSNRRPAGAVSIKDAAMVPPWAQNVHDPLAPRPVSERQAWADACGYGDEEPGL